MKKILIVGGGLHQVPLIQAAKAQGYYVIVVDYAGENCPAYKMVDRLYDVSTQDEDAILEVAVKEEIDGIISNSEPSMLIVNSIAGKLNLIGNPVDAVKALMSKSGFRNLQKRTGVYAPACYEVASVREALSVSEVLVFPIIIKPCESSGSRGCRRIDRFDPETITSAFHECKHYSRNGMVVMEEYVPMPSLRTIEGDIFINCNSIIWDGLFYTTRPAWAPMVPMTYSAPMIIDDSRLDMIKSTVSRVINASGIRFGQFNMEGFFTESGEFFIIEMNARQGGNFLPGFLQRFTGINYHRLLVTTCVGDYDYLTAVMEKGRKCRYAIMSSVYSQKDGIYKGLTFATSIKDKITNVTELVSVGDKVEKCVDGTSIVASVNLEFDSLEEIYDFTPGIIDSICVELS